jgi:8-oxo-dGTP pyrophosphatase MutT (NUDIX family)
VKNWRTRIAWLRLLIRHRWTYLVGLVGVGLSVATFSLQSVGTGIAAVVGLLAGVLGVMGDRRAWGEAQRELLVRPADDRSSDDWVLSGELLRAGYVLDRAQPASIHAPEVNRALRQGADASIELLRRQAPERPGALCSAVILRRHFRSDAVLFNAAKVSQLDDLQLVGGVLQSVRLRESRYFDGLVTNEFAGLEIQGLGGHAVFNGDSLFVENGKVLPLAQSSSSNAVGMSTLALTRDNVLVISRQGARGAVSAGLLAPSGSGSADWADARQATSLRDLVVRVAERELVEECGLPAGARMTTEVLAYTRLLHRGGKPEFYCFTHVDVEYAHIGVRRQERDLMFEHLPLRIDEPLRIREQVARFFDEHHASLSPVLRSHARFFDDALAAGWSPFTDSGDAVGQ